MSGKHKIKCLNCGKCCGNCPYLVRYQDGHTMCMIYHHRLGAEIGEGRYCQKRGNNYIPGCPYNKR